MPHATPDYIRSCLHWGKTIRTRESFVCYTKMKSALVFLCVALFVGVSLGASICNPDGDGKPDCAGRAGLVARDFWDPTHYWVCDNSGNAVLAECQQQGFDPKTGQCVDWAVWQWYAPCP